MAVAPAWAKPGSWALAAEEQDDLPPPPPPVVPAADFPDLATAATAKVPKKKKPKAVSLGDFAAGKFVAPASRRDPGPMELPTGPRERTEEELANARGFGAARWGGAGGGGGPRSSDEPRRGGSGSEDFGPSRADEADDWGAGKKPPMDRRERIGGFGGDLSAPRADDVDDWVSAKRSAPAPYPERRERVGGDSHSRSDDSASWVSSKSYSALPPPPADGRRGGPVWGFNRDGGPDTDSWGRRREEVTNGGGNMAGRPRLNLQKRTLPLANGIDGEEDYKEKGEERPRSRSSNPFGAARPREEVLAAKGENWRKEEPKVEKLEIQPRTRSSNPFGAARPREEVLAEKGEDWRKIDEKLEAMKVREAPPERRSLGRRGSPVAGEENGNAQGPESRAERAWKKPDAVDPAKESEEGSETTDKSVPAN
ncbi:eukaryotic translation initiation factor 4B3-like [Phragmites australis]|uniref:eukaryotic translation initiation factor 4B3-like n=1 Tax=Phragmites australis TaxID=29695 RepID=UPI002D77F932|nr:eukaryotic translation initiation factor 4B3-like [Phragmites australis]